MYIDHQIDRKIGTELSHLIYNYYSLNYESLLTASVFLSGS